MKTVGYGIGLIAGLLMLSSIMLAGVSQAICIGTGGLLALVGRYLVSQKPKATVSK